MDLRFDLTNPKDKAMLGKLRRGSPVQVKPIHFDENYGSRVRIEPKDNEMLKKLRRAMKSGKGVRICLSPDEMMEGEGLVFTKLGRVASGSIAPTSYKRFSGKIKSMKELEDKIESGTYEDEMIMEGGKVKSLKQLNRETSRAFKKAGKDIKKAFTEDVPEITRKAVKGYKEKVRPYASPVFKELFTNVVPELAGKAVEEGLKSQGVSPMGAKVSGRLVKAGLKKPMTMGYKKSGLGLKSDMAKAMKESGRLANRGMKYLGSGASVPVPVVGGAMKIHRMDKGTYETAFKEETPTLMRGGRLFTEKMIDPTASAYEPNVIANQYTPIQLGKGLYAGRGLF